jgi:uncharacterized membrane protein
LFFVFWSLSCLFFVFLFIVLLVLFLLVIVLFDKEQAIQWPNRQRKSNIMTKRQRTSNAMTKKTKDK